MVVIKDGNTGNVAKVTAENMLRTYSVTEAEIAHVSEEEGLAFSWSNVSYDYDALDTILLVKNTSATKKLIIDKVIISADVATVAVLHLPACATPTGTAVIGVNLRRDSGNVADATAIGDETTNTQANIIKNFQLLAATDTVYDTQGSIVLGQNDCIAVDFVTNGAVCYATFDGHYHAA
jgi:hypothetical protein